MPRFKVPLRAATVPALLLGAAALRLLKHMIRSSRSFRSALLSGVLLAAVALFATANAKAQGIVMYLSPPGEQNTTRPGAVVEDFSGPVGPIAAAGNFAVGPWTNATLVRLLDANVVGGAGGVGRFLDVANTGEVTVTLTGNRKYVGFWWSAGNAGNTIEFYDDSNALLGSFTTTSLTALLGGAGNITAIDGSQYAKTAYYDNPNPPPGRNTVEPYGYINLVLEGTTANFRRIVIRHAGTGRFELDNLAVVDAATVPGAWVRVTPASNPAAIPTLSQWGLIILSVLMGAFTLGWRHQRN